MTPDSIAAPLRDLTLPHDLSPWGMFLAADIVVQAVMVGLVFASVTGWSIGLAKIIESYVARRRVSVLRDLLARCGGLAEAERSLTGHHGHEGRLVDAAIGEVRQSAGMAAEGTKERIALRIGRLEAAALRRMSFGTGVLAIIAATAPFVGLFGTVWGIMNSFVGISRAQTTNLAVVAPGIAEALLATALGLVAAIPAVVLYNFLTRCFAGYKVGLGDVGAEIMRLVSRDLDRSAHARREAAE
jgi:biopolymer transport protein ExbB